jgi:quercetin dioxygenase-like cupin family protein
MRRSLKTMLALAAIAGAIVSVRGVRATPPSGFTGSTLALGRIDEIDVRNHALVPEDLREAVGRKAWVSLQRTKGPSDLYVQSNVWAPGGSTGWHTHPGHSLIIVTAGTVTSYDGDDPSCTPHEYAVGEAFVDAGGDHVHLLRNEGAVEARTVAVQLIPAAATRRIDAQGPVGCPL